MEPETRTPARRPVAVDVPHSFTLRSACVVTAPKVCRDFVSGVVRAIGCEELVEAAAVCTSELVTNSYLHAEGANLLLRVRVSPGRVRVTVLDGSAVRLAGRRAPEEEALSGRGLFLVAALADRCGTADCGGVWFELDAARKAV
ncbi:ATP-binding protein [Streptomyces sp. H10-C2]|uniref:ATP-binding protein n=1 Tax=unclassified Streptomyces TaxID=2593676 RepID=UPI0024B9CF76|nr:MULTISPECIES: ATP-binding protein [unclassified Streptomyces]MDJ0344629.1 ATP-binding protein [Streptomyces sp. PH10-H1]MDJ0373211.1 ATP-binding protein [Streptomyces sp. H10-C2]